jgi:hypothetical protein
MKSSTESQGALCGVGGTEQDEEEDSVSSKSSQDEYETQVVRRSSLWKGVHVYVCVRVECVYTGSNQTSAETSLQLRTHAYMHTYTRMCSAQGRIAP